MTYTMVRRGFVGEVCYSDTDMVDWNWLQRLDTIGHLEFWGQEIDANNLRQLPPIYEIKFERCKVSNLAPLAANPALYQLEFNCSPEHDWPQLAGIHLRTLCLNENNISDISFVNLLDKCLCELVLRRNCISDISPLFNLGNLEYLALDENQVCDILPLLRLCPLPSLSIQRNKINAQNKQALLDKYRSARSIQNLVL